MNNFYNRLHVLNKAYLRAKKSNTAYTDAKQKLETTTAKINTTSNLIQALKILNVEIASAEEQWRNSILIEIENEIAKALSFVFPEDGYTVHLDSRILRGKLHISSSVSSINSSKIEGSMKYTQGMLFRQIVVIASVVYIMQLKGFNTIYFDEAFSGAATKNILKVRNLIDWYRERGINLILIAQNQSIITGNEHSVVLTRDNDNVTKILGVDTYG